MKEKLPVCAPPPPRKIARSRVVKRSSISSSKSVVRRTISKSTVRCDTITHSTKGAVSSKHAMVTRGTTTMAARNAVFNTQELMEGILLHLSTKDLLTAEGVCSHWRATAKTSPRLMREKFLTIVKKHDLLWLDRANELVKNQQPTDLPRFGAAWLARQTTIHTSSLNTMLFALASDADRTSLVDRCNMCETITFLFQPNLASAWKLNTITKQMFVANPPPVNVELEIAFAHVSGKTGRMLRSHSRAVAPERYTVEKPRGVTWADVVQEMDIALFCANAKQRRSKGRVVPELVIDVKKCKLWMRGVVFLTEGEKEMLDEGGLMGKKSEVKNSEG